MQGGNVGQQQLHIPCVMQFEPEQLANLYTRSSQGVLTEILLAGKLQPTIFPWNRFDVKHIADMG